MSIQVQCPNPDCGKVHKAKDKYAGMQCYCPACRAVMDVPPLPGAASAPAVEPFAADELLAGAPALDVAADEAAVPEEVAADDAVQLEAGPPGEEEELAKEEVLLAELEAEEASAPAQPRPKPKGRR